MERCPCCNARLRERSLCSRCKADLNALINAEKAAKNFFAKAMQYWQLGHIEQSIAALELSLSLKETSIAVAFRGFIIEQQNKKILELLAQKQYLMAKQALYRLRRLQPYSHTLQTINAFSEYLYFAD